jgi:hypothetical protein
MANFILGNTTGEICCEIQQSYMRLTGNYVGPLCTSNFSTSGFLIKDANDNSGIYVANCAIQTCKNKIEYTDANSTNPAHLILPANKCFYISGNNSLYSFSDSDIFSIGSGFYSAFEGLQSFSSSPSVTLIPKTAAINNAFRSLNSFCEVQFYICQSDNSGICLSGSNAFRFDNLDKQGVYYISGNSTSVSGLPLSSYSFANYGNSYFNAASLFSGNINLAGTGCFNAPDIGLDVDTKSIFKKDSIFSGNIILTGGYNLFSDGAFYFTTGIFPSISGTGDIIFNNSFFNNVEANSVSGTGTSYFNCAEILELYVGNGYFNCIRPAVENDYLIISGYSNLHLCGSFFCNFGSFFNNGNFTNTGNGNFYNICTTGLSTSRNVFSGCMFVSNDICNSGFICSWGSVSGLNFLTTGLISGANISGTNISGQTFTQLNGSTITCFASSGLHIGTLCTGYVKAVNTAKAWGVFSLKDGVPTLLTGYNACSITIPITGIAASGNPGSLKYFPTGNLVSGQWNYPYVMYGIALNELVKAPFTFNLQFHPVSCFDTFSNVTTGYGTHATNFSGYQRTGWFATSPTVSGFGYYSGSSGNVAGAASTPFASGVISTGVGGSGLATAWGPLGPYYCSMQAPLFSTLVNCAGKNTFSPTTGNYSTGDFSKIALGSSYGEIIFSLLPASVALQNREYYKIENNALNGTGTFVIFGY